MIQDVVEPPPIILEEVVWKLRGGFGKYSGTVGTGPSWERRRIALSTKRLTYYAKVSKSTTLDKSPRGVLDILPDRTTITATYPGDASQPTTFCITIKTIDPIAHTDVTKWRICFDDRETQLLWLVALTDNVTDVSVNEYNGNVLTAKKNNYEHRGFRTMYDKGGGRLLDLVHNALLSSGRTPANQRSSLTRRDDGDGEEIEVVQHSMNEIHVMGDSQVFANQTSSTIHNGNSNYDEKQLLRTIISDEKIFQALAVAVASLLFEKAVNLSSPLLWKTVTAIILCICFAGPDKSSLAEKRTSKVVDETDEMQSTTSSSKKILQFARNTTEFSALTCMSESILPETEFKNRKEVPLSVEMKAHDHERWAISAPNVDLSGEWSLIANEAFVLEYDTYLKRLGFSKITRKVACSLIGRTTEITKQSDNGRNLFMKGVNPKGVWERMLTSSGYPDFDTDDSELKEYSHTKSTIKTADAEDVDAEAWWEELGTKHRSWLRGSKKYGGGDFESVRYLEVGSNGNVLVCNSIFHPTDPSKEKAVVTWRFIRDC